jgi:hypothetical protein
MPDYAAGDTNRDGIYSDEERAAWAAGPGSGKGHSNGFKTPWGPIGGGGGGKSQEELDRERLRKELEAASGFAGQGQAGFGALGAEAAQGRDYLRSIAEGKHSVSAEQLRQGMQQGLAAQRSMAASARPANAAMAARTAAMQGARLGYGLSGQQAVAGLQERQQAQQALNEMLLRQRQQELDAALGSRGQAITGTGQSLANPEKSWWEKYGAPIANVGALVASDKRLKEEIDDGEDESRRVVEGLKAYTFKYKDSKFGKGKQLGVMAQDLEKAGLGHAVIETPEGKAVHGAKLATSNTAMIAALGRRIAQLEGKERGK